MSIKKKWESVSFGWRHFTDSSEFGSKKRKNIISNVTKFLFANLDFDDIENSLDWGCGGGLLAKELSNYSNISIVDITKDSIENALKYLSGVNDIYHQELPENIDDFVFGGPKIDLIFSHAVIHHFPSLEYFNKVLLRWKLIDPKYIAIQVKLSDKTKECSNYERDFIDAIYFSEADLTEHFSNIGYNITSKNYTTTARGIKLGYYTFIKGDQG